MKVSTRRLPGAVKLLLEAFSRDTGAGITLWDRSGPEPVPLCTFGRDGSGGTAWREPVRPGYGEELELEVDGGRAQPPDAAFVAQAVARILSYEREAQLAARELAERYEEINLLYSISETLGSVVSLEAAASRILAEVADLLSARRASLWVYDEADAKLHLAAAVGEAGLSSPIEVDDPDSVTAEVFRERQPVNIEAGARTAHGKRLEPVPHARESFLSVPIQFTPPEGPARTVGVITVIGRAGTTSFDAGDVRLLSAIAGQVAAAIETHRLMEENVRQERFLREMELAHDLQMKLLPDTSAFDGTWDVAARCAPAESVGGDFYHLFRLSDNRLGVMIGDVSSHGFSAALIMALTMSAVAIYAQEAGPPAEVLRRIHDALIGELESTEMYVSLFYGVLDPGAGRLTYANAGHPHAFRVPEQGPPQRLRATSPPLGVVALGEYREAQCEWHVRQDLLCLFTDGLSDAFSRAGSVSGERALVRELSQLRDRPVTEILDALFQRAAQATDLGVPPDDRTAVLVRA